MQIQKRLPILTTFCQHRRRRPRPPHPLHLHLHLHHVHHLTLHRPVPQLRPPTTLKIKTTPLQRTPTPVSKQNAQPLFQIRTLLWKAAVRRLLGRISDAKDRQRRPLPVEQQLVEYPSPRRNVGHSWWPSAWNHARGRPAIGRKKSTNDSSRRSQYMARNSMWPSPTMSKLVHPNRCVRMPRSSR